MDWEIKKRGRVTYYRKKTNDVFSDLIVETLDNGDLKIRFVGMTGALAATNELGLDEVARMDPEKKIPRIFDTIQPPATNLEPWHSIKSQQSRQYRSALPKQHL